MKTMTETTYDLCLYIAGASIASDQALENLMIMNSTMLQNRCEIKVVDLRQDPSLARKHRIIAIPTLERLLPLTTYRVVGDLSMTKEVLSGLDIPFETKAEDG